MKPRRKASLALLLAAGVLCSARTYAGAIEKQIGRTGEKIRGLEDALDQTDKNISAWQRQQKELEREIADGQEQVSRLSAELDHTKEEIAKTQKKIAKTQEALEGSKEDSRQQYKQMKQRIRFMYENSTTDMVMYVLDSGSLSEALRRAEYFQAVMAYDRQKLEEYKATTRKIKKEKEKLAEEQAQLKSLEEKQEGQLEGIDAAVAGMKEKLGDKISQIQASEALQKQYEQELERQKRYEQELEQQKAEEDKRREEEIRRQEEELKRIREEERRRKAEEEEQKRQAEREAEQDSRQQGSSPGGSPSVSGSGSSPAASAGDLELLSAIIYCEAGNQPYEGQLAVGSVILNRVASSSFPNSISGVIYQSGQFSPVASGRFAHALAAGLGSHCTSAAQAVLNGSRNVDCLYFRIDNGEIDGTVIGNHVFY